MTRGWLIASLAIVLGALSVGSARGESRVRHLLNSNVPSTKFDNVPMSDCIDFLNDVSGANIIVDWKTLAAASIAKDTAINLRVKNTSLEQVLNLILAQASTAADVLTFYIDRDVIQVTTKAQADKHVYTIVYDVRDLLLTIPSVTASTNTGGYGGQGGYGQGNYGGGFGSGGSGYGPSAYGNGYGSQGAFGNQNGFGNPGGFGSQGQFGQGQFGNPGGYNTTSQGGSGNGYGTSTGSNSNNSTSTSTQAQALIKLIEAVVQPNAWDDTNGKATAYISEWNGTLIVTAPRSVQEAIGGPFD